MNQSDLKALANDLRQATGLDFRTRPGDSGTIEINGFLLTFGQSREGSGCCALCGVVDVVYTGMRKDA